MSPSARISVKAVIVVDGRILLTRHRDSDGPYYLLPGGGQRHGEDLGSALQRECCEETSILPQVGRLLFVRDYIGRNHEFALSDGDSHQVELMFECTCDPSAAARLGHAPDTRQEGTEWVELGSLRGLRLFPRALVDRLADGLPSAAPDLPAIYLGDVN